MRCQTKALKSLLETFFSSSLPTPIPTDIPPEKIDSLTDFAHLPNTIHSCYRLSLHKHFLSLAFARSLAHFLSFEAFFSSKTDYTSHGQWKLRIVSNRKRCGKVSTEIRSERSADKIRYYQWDNKNCTRYLKSYAEWNGIVCCICLWWTDFSIKVESQWIFSEWNYTKLKRVWT